MYANYDHINSNEEIRDSILSNFKKTKEFYKKSQLLRNRYPIKLIVFVILTVLLAIWFLSIQNRVAAILTLIPIVLYTYIQYYSIVKKCVRICKSIAKNMDIFIHNEKINESQILEMLQYASTLREILIRFKQAAPCLYLTVIWHKKLDDIIIDFDDIIEECSIAADSEIRDLVEKLNEAL